MCVEKIEHFKRQQQIKKKVKDKKKTHDQRKHIHETEQCFSHVYFYDFIIGTLESSSEKKKERKKKRNNTITNRVR